MMPSATTHNRRPERLEKTIDGGRAHQIPTKLSWDRTPAVFAFRREIERGGRKARSLTATPRLT
jgi:hypothetical protein